MRHRRFRFETQKQPVLSRQAFAKRVAQHLLAASLFIMGSLFFGMLGYWYFEGMSWIDAFLNASMILSGMGPVGQLHSWGGKLFAGFFALYSGLLVIFATGLLLSPFVHRLLHCFHVDSDEPLQQSASQHDKSH